jgi:general secretion pathway protein L
VISTLKRIIDGNVMFARGVASIVRVWTWWTAELFGMLPNAWRSALASGSGRLFVTFDNDDLILGVLEGDRVAELIRSSAEQEERAVLVRDYCDEHRLNAAAAILALSRKQAMIKNLSLPAAVEENLDGMLRFEMDRHTPFSAEDVYFTHRVVSRDRDTARIAVELVVVPRRSASTFIEMLADIGVTPSSMVVDGREQPIEPGVFASCPNLLAAGGKVQNRSVSRRGRIRLMQAVAFLFAVAVLMPVIDQRLIQQSLQQQVVVAKEAATRAEDARSQLRALLEPGKEFARLRSSTPLAVAVLNEVTEIVPDDTWLNRLEIGRGQIRLQGESEQAAALLALFEANQMFSDARFSSTVTRNARSERDRFAIEATITVPVSQ